MTEPFDRPTDDATASAHADAAADAFTLADHVSAGEALAPDMATGSTEGGGATAASADVVPMEALTTDAPQAETSAPDDDLATEMEPGDASLLGLIDRLGAILERSDLTELEVESGRTTVILRKPTAVVAPIAAATAPPVLDASAAAASPAPAAEGSRGAAGGGSAPSGGGAPARPSVKAPLTGIWYASPTPGSAPFVEVGRELAVGQVVGLIEAMKLFNEIKSDLAGRVVRVVPDSGTLVKAKQPLIEVEPL
jgi:acetyl-CoA carboxylase biotin carboxyl carrier protein